MIALDTLTGRVEAGWIDRIEAAADCVDFGSPDPVEPGSLSDGSDFAGMARASLDGRELSDRQAEEILTCPEGDLPELLGAAYAVRRVKFARRVKVCVLLNARSGLCPEDCGYCSQAKTADTGVDRYRLMEADAIVARAKAAADAGAKRFCIVCSGRGPSDKDIAHIGEAVRRIKDDLRMEVCCSLGLTSRPQADALKSAGVDYVNHNLNTSREHYEKICSTHTYDDRLETIENVRAAGLSTCAGGIVGLGETDRDVVSMLREARVRNIASVPINFLIAFDGTPLEGTTAKLSWQQGLRVLSLARLLLPDREVRMAAGRERKLGGRQGLSLYAANSIFVDGYLTSEGQAAADAKRMVEDAGFEVET